MATRSPSGERLSCSSANLMQGCELRFVHYKVLKTEPDPDTSKSNALEVGSCFHLICETVKHKLNPNLFPMLKQHEDLDYKKTYSLLEKTFKDSFIEKEGLNAEDFPLVCALATYYLKRINSKLEFECLGVEKEIYNDKFIGYVDALFKVKNKLYIIDLKTSAYRLTPEKKAMLQKNFQLNMYAYFYDELKMKYNINLEFGGVGYFSLVKPRVKKKKSESDFSFYVRLIEKMIDEELADLLLIDKSKLKVEETKFQFEELYKRSMDLRKGTHPIPNYNYCEAYFRPCPYFSRCHGHLPKG